MIEEVISAVATPTPVPVVEATADYSEILSRLDTLINLQSSIYAWIALFITLVVGGFVIWQVLRPLTYFFYK